MTFFEREFVARLKHYPEYRPLSIVPFESIAGLLSAIRLKMNILNTPSINLHPLQAKLNIALMQRFKLYLLHSCFVLYNSKIGNRLWLLMGYFSIIVMRVVTSG